MAFRRFQALARGRHVLTMQYHQELLGTTVEDWSEISVYQQALEASLVRERSTGWRGKSTLNYWGLMKPRPLFINTGGQPRFRNELVFFFVLLRLASWLFRLLSF